MHTVKTTTLLLFIALPVTADIYRWTDDSGATHYADSAPGYSDAYLLDRTDLPRLHTITRQNDNASPSTPSRKSPRRRTGHVYQLHGPAPTADFDTCMAQKRKAVQAERRRDKTRVDALDGWLWEHCRAYSNALRKVSQSMM